MSARIQPISEISHRATSMLIREIGIVDTIRFLNQFRSGSGDYTMEREELFREMSVDDVLDDIKAKRRGA
jgi:hypothetical protein